MCVYNGAAAAAAVSNLECFVFVCSGVLVAGLEAQLGNLMSGPRCSKRVSVLKEFDFFELPQQVNSSVFDSLGCMVVVVVEVCGACSFCEEK